MSYSNGDYAYFKSVNPYDSNIYYGEIVGNINSEHLGKLYELGTVWEIELPEFNKTRMLSQNMYCSIDECDTSCDNLFSKLRIKSDEQVDKYYKEIKTLRDLLEFPINHCINGEEYTDENAATAYKIKIKEVLDKTDKIVAAYRGDR